MTMPIEIEQTTISHIVMPTKDVVMFGAAINDNKPQSVYRFPSFIPCYYLGRHSSLVLWGDDSTHFAIPFISAWLRESKIIDNIRRVKKMPVRPTAEIQSIRFPDVKPLSGHIPFGSIELAHYIEPQGRRTLALSSFAIRLHLLQLPLHDSPLMMGVERGNKNSYKADTSGSPKTNNPRFLPPILLCIFGASLVICTVKFLLYAMDSANKLFYVAFLGGFPFFCVGIALILFCFLYDPPTIFGFSIGSWHLVPL